MAEPVTQNQILSDPEEARCYNNHINAFQNYSRDVFQQYPNQPKDLISLNQKLLNLLCPKFLPSPQSQSNAPTTAMDKSKVRSTIKQFYREWCSQSTELQTTYDRILQIFKKHKQPHKDIKVLLPGCGLGRIVFEFVKAGYSAQGNEVSYFMLFGSDFILNSVQEKQSIQIAPFVHIHEQLTKKQHRLRTVRIPDVVVSQEVGEEGGPQFQMVAGDFVQVYNNRPQHFGGVVTCYFLDTANNVFNYIDTVLRTLQPGGIWVNYGPLLFHYRDTPKEISIQISWETLLKYIATKFTILESGFDNGSTYCHFPEHREKVVYKCGWFVARKAPKPQNTV